MAKTKTFNTNIDDGLIHFTFTNNAGEVFSKFHINPTDVGLASRSQEVVKYLEELSKQEFSTVESIQKLDEMIAERVDYLLGYEASKTIFPAPYTPTTILPDGSMFVNTVISVIEKALRSEIEDRIKKMKKVEKATEKYRNQ